MHNQDEPVLIFSPEKSERSPSSRTRVYEIAKSLEGPFHVIVLPVKGTDDNFVETNVQLVLNTMKLFGLARKSRDETKVLIHRGIDLSMRVILAAVWRRVTGGVLIFDFDDSIFLSSPWKTRTACSQADAVVVSNPTLAAFAVECNPNTFVLPTAIDLKLYRPKKIVSAVPVIGWIGTASNLPFLRVLNKPLRLLSQREDFVFRIITDLRFRSQIPLDADLPVEVEKWSYPDFVRGLASFEIGVCPMPDTPWTRGKSGYKVLEYMAMEVPPLASAVGENCRILDHGATGFLISREDEWLAYMLRLLDDDGLRLSIGRAARRVVEEHFSLEKNARQLAGIMVSVTRDGLSRQADGPAPVAWKPTSRRQQ